MNHRPRVAFFGSSLVSAYWNGAATYYRGIIRALSAIGYSITFYEPDAYHRQEHRDIADPDWAKVVVYPTADRTGVLSALDDAAQADVIVKASGVGVFDTELEAAVPELRHRNKLVVFWDVDAPATLDRVERHGDDPFRALVPKYDLVLTYGGGECVVTRYRRLGARRCVPIYNALDPATHFPVNEDERFRCDLGLLANRLPDRERRVDEFFLRAATLLPNHRFVLGGSGWDTKRLPGNVSYVGHVFTRDHNAFNASARAVLNVARDSMAETGFSPATRVFEAAGAGACLITDAWKGIEHFLEPGEEILVAADGTEVARTLASLTEAKARAIGEAARRRVLREHTYAHRAAEVDSLLNHGASTRSMFATSVPRDCKGSTP